MLIPFSAACAPARGGAVLFWDVDAAIPGAGGPLAGGVWDTGVTPNWSPDPGGAVPTGVWAAGATAVFSAGADADGAFGVVIPAGVFIPGVDGISFEEGAVAIVPGGPLAALFLTTPFVNTDPLASGNIDVLMGGPGLGLMKVGPGVLTINAPPPGPLTVGAGRLVIDVGAAPAVIKVPALTLTGGSAPLATLEINNNAFVVDYMPGASPFGVIMDQIATGYDGGTWAGRGITTSMGTATGFGIGYAEADDLAVVPPIFGVVDDSSVLFRFTRFGDADLNGTVSLPDFNKLAASFGAAGVWSEGDFNYDGVVGLGDFNLMASNFGLAATGRDAPTPADWAALAAAVPEPSLMGFSGVAASAAMLRRRRRS